MKKNIYSLFAIILLLTSSAYTQHERGLGLDSSNASSNRRIALVIGNGAYASASLKNPPNDATDMALALSKVGFTVEHAVDLTQRQMKAMIREFGQKLKAGGQGLFYFAGHGVQLKGRNYLIPVDAEIASEADVEDQGVDANLVLNLMDEAGNGLNVVILDACRNNPFARSFRSASNGLAQVDAPTGTLVAYSTAPGRVARDGTGRNGAYTAELLKQISVPGLPIEELLKRVRANLKQQTNGEQVPWESSSLVGSFYLNNAAGAGGAPNNNTATTTPSAPALDPAAIELAYWDTIKNSTDTNDFKAYLQEYPNGRFVALAKNRITSIGASLNKTVPTRTDNNENAFNFNGFFVRILYREKDGVNRLEDASKVAARLKSLGALVDVVQNNEKNYKNKVFYHDPEGEVAIKIAKSIEDIVQVYPERTKDGKRKEFYIWLQ